MVRIISMVCLLVFVLSFSSCASTKKAETEREVAGYNLKSKKERMHNKILNNKNKPMLAAQ